MFLEKGTFELKPVIFLLWSYRSFLIVLPSGAKYIPWKMKVYKFSKPNETVGDQLNYL